MAIGYTSTLQQTATCLLGFKSPAGSYVIIRLITVQHVSTTHFCVARLDPLRHVNLKPMPKDSYSSSELRHLPLKPQSRVKP